MPQTPVDENSRVALRIPPADKAMLLRAVALEQTNMTDFILRTVLREAKAIIEEHEHLKLNRQNSLAVLELLENPPAPNSKLRKAARAIPDLS